VLFLIRSARWTIENKRRKVAKKQEITQEKKLKNNEMDQGKKEDVKLGERELGSK
jgi:hypothetical protein